MKTRSTSRSTSPAPPNAQRSPPPVTPGFRRAAPLPRTRRFRSGAASETCCSTTSRPRSATASSTAHADAQHNSGRPGRSPGSRSPGGGQNQFTVGAAFDRSSVGFLQSTELGYLNPDRSVTGVDAFGDGVTGGDVDGEPFDTRVDLDGRSTPGASTRPTRCRVGALERHAVRPIQPHDHRQQRPHQPGGGPGSLDGDHVFGRFNPAAGVTYSPARAVNVYVGYSEGSRAPTSIELGCADPEQPCKLPNAMAGDPPLDQVVDQDRGSRPARRRRGRRHTGTSACSGRTTATTSSSSRPIKPASATSRTSARRAGRASRSDVSSRIGRVSARRRLHVLDATYQSPETVDGSSNSTNDAAKTAQGTRGHDRDPARRSDSADSPAHAEGVRRRRRSHRNSRWISAWWPCRARTRAATRTTSTSPTAHTTSDRERRPATRVFNLGARYQVQRRVQIVAQINNLFDRQYYTAAQLGPTGFTETGAFIARPFPAVDGEFPVAHATFYAPGAPITVWAGTRIRF